MFLKKNCNYKLLNNSLFVILFYTFQCNTYTGIHQYILEIKRTPRESNISLQGVYLLRVQFDVEKIPLKNYCNVFVIINFSCVTKLSR